MNGLELAALLMFGDLLIYSYDLLAAQWMGLNWLPNNALNGLKLAAQWMGLNGLPNNALNGLELAA